MSYRFILDTNVLDSESIAVLRKAGLERACRSGRYSFYITPVLLKERLDFASKSKIPPRVVEPIKFLLDLKWQRLFNEPGGPEGVFTRELEGKLQSQYLFTDYTQIKENLRLILDGGEFIEDAKREILDDKLRWSEKKKRNKDTYRSMRDEVNQKLKNSSMSRKGSKFSDFLKHNFEQTAIDKVEHSINSIVSKDVLVEYWKKYKERCPYFNKFVEGCLFMAWHVMAAEQEPKIDINAYEDIEHSIYLIGIDGIVSNEKGFIKTACRELFPDKDFLSIHQFAKRLRYE